MTTPDEQPGVQERLSTLEDAFERHADLQVPIMWASGQEWGNSMDRRLTDHDTRIEALERRAGPSDPPVGV